MFAVSFVMAHKFGIYIMFMAVPQPSLSCPLLGAQVDSLKMESQICTHPEANLNAVFLASEFAAGEMWSLNFRCPASVLSLPAMVDVLQLPISCIPGCLSSQRGVNLGRWSFLHSESFPESQAFARRFGLWSGS